ncbi:peptidase M24 [Brevibacillus choshinensis]|uniref:Peptidase M24 n=2 Tax=Brevibacillus choshinensis TaxID=54911 RepID=A0ABR5NF86_BRECH|nr:peptidase M24 [Brevibacillus choshinensis]
MQRQAVFQTRLQQSKLDGAVLFRVADIFYLTGFHFLPTERPIAFLVDPGQQTHLFVPELEREHAESTAYVDHVHSYPEYPSLRHPMEYLKDLLQETHFEGKRLGLDTDGYGSSMGYCGPAFSSLIHLQEKGSLEGWVEEMRFVKSVAEIELIRESCRWANLAHQLLQDYSAVGMREIEVSARATMEATLIMADALGPSYKPHGTPANAFFRGQVGPMSAYPHSFTQNIVMKKGNNLVTAALADVWGYKSELERTMFVEEVSPEQEHFFHLMKQAQEVAFGAIKPHIPASKVDDEVQRFIQENNLREYCPHHSGHAIGLLGHEAPFFDLGDHTILKPGMVFSVEPGIFVKGLGGFRHSDTVVVTETGMEFLTFYPRDLESLICS